MPLAKSNELGDTEVWTSEPRLSDESLVRTAAGGDLTVFDTPVLRYQDRIFNLTHRLTGNPDEAEDVTQEVFLRAHRALVKLKIVLSTPAKTSRPTERK